jgi:hypothetical protein
MSYNLEAISDLITLFSSKAETRACRLCFQLLQYRWTNGMSESQPPSLFHFLSIP